MNEAPKPAGSAGKVLIVEDDEAMRAGLKDGFEFEGFAVTLATDGEAALSLWKARRPDLLILDVMLPKLSGLDVCKRIRREGSRTPIIMLTARGQEIDKVMGLKIGADDYVTKPFSFLELMARVGAVLRRSTPGGDRELTLSSFGDVTVDFRKGQLMKAGKKVELSARELRLLEFFIAHRGEVLSREVLLREVWGHSNESEMQTRTVDMHVAKLRKKVESAPSHPRYLLTVHNAGYKLAD